MFKQSKFDIETLFNDNWKDTPIHFGGQEFKPHDYGNPDEWVNIVVTPLRTSNASISRGATNFEIQLFVVIWSKNDVRNMELLDAMNLFVEDNLTMRHNGSTVNDHGWNEANSVYTVVDYVFKYNTSCVASVTPLPIIDTITHNTEAVTHNGDPVTNTL